MRANEQALYRMTAVLPRMMMNMTTHGWGGEGVHSISFRSIPLPLLCQCDTSVYGEHLFSLRTWFEEEEEEGVLSTAHHRRFRC